MVLCYRHLPGFWKQFTMSITLSFLVDTSLFPSPHVGGVSEILKAKIFCRGCPRLQGLHWARIIRISMNQQHIILGHFIPQVTFTKNVFYFKGKMQFYSNQEQSQVLMWLYRIFLLDLGRVNTLYLSGPPVTNCFSVETMWLIAALLSSQVGRKQIRYNQQPLIECIPHVLFNTSNSPIILIL